MNPDEEVLCFSTASLELHDCFKFKGFAKSNPLRNNICFEHILKDSSFLRRGDVEANPEFRQVIAYILIRRNEEYLSYERGKHSGEDRLKNLLSLGIGGHVNRVEHTDNKYITVKANMCRELDEELKFFSYFNTIISGYINDESNDVGKVHYGVVFTVDTISEHLVARDAAVVNPQFYTKDEVLENYDRYESWSKLLIDGMVR